MALFLKMAFVAEPQKNSQADLIVGNGSFERKNFCVFLLYSHSNNTLTILLTSDTWGFSHTKQFPMTPAGGVLQFNSVLRLNRISADPTG